MKEKFKYLKEQFGTHKAAAKYIGISYNRYNEWRYDPESMPEYSRRLVELAAESLKGEE